MDGCNTKWLRSVIGAIRRYPSGGDAPLPHDHGGRRGLEVVLGATPLEC